MKKCFTINPFRSLKEIKSYHKLIEENLFQGIEIFYPYNVDEERANIYTQGIKEIREKYPYLEIVMHLPHGPRGNLCDLENYEKIVKLMKDAIDYSSKFGIKKLTLHLGIVNKEAPREIYLEHIKNVLEDLCTYANKYEMNIMIENMPGIGELGYSPNEILEIIESVKNTNLKFILDTGHANVSGYKISEYVHVLKDHLLHLHLNDNSGKRDEHAKLGTGNIDFQKFVDLMNEINYQELYCLEIIFSDDNDLRSNANDLAGYDK